MCSNPNCRQLTCGPQIEQTGSINVGVAAHITAASPGGSRYDNSLSAKQRKAPNNGIWLCQKCAWLIDSDESLYTEEKLRAWRKLSEAAARQELESRPGTSRETKSTPFEKLETLIPELLAEMREDLVSCPVEREFVLLEKCWTYNASGSEFAYYYDDHSNLRSKIYILENYGLVENITYTSVDRFSITEELADYLLSPH